QRRHREDASRKSHAKAGSKIGSNTRSDGGGPRYPEVSRAAVTSARTTSEPGPYGPQGGRKLIRRGNSYEGMRLGITLKRLCLSVAGSISAALLAAIRHQVCQGDDTMTIATWLHSIPLHVKFQFIDRSSSAATAPLPALKQLLTPRQSTPCENPCRGNRRR